MEQQQIMQIQMMEQEGNQLNQQMQMIEQNIHEMNELKASLDELENHKEGEMLVNIGKRIYLPVEAKNKKLIVEVGKGHLIEKNVSEAREIVEEQIGKLNVGRMQVEERLGELQNEMMRMMGEIESSQKKEGESSTSEGKKD
jgi:prefoldin alpha subunit